MVLVPVSCPREYIFSSFRPSPPVVVSTSASGLLSAAPIAIHGYLCAYLPGQTMLSARYFIPVAVVESRLEESPSSAAAAVHLI